MKYFIAASLVILVINASYAQTKLGLKLTSSIISQRISHSHDSIEISNGSNTFIPAVTLFADMPLSKNYFFSTGIGYISKRINLKVNGFDDQLSQTKSYTVQYIQLPATLKLYTNEIALDKKLYFQFGPLIEIAVHNKENNQNLQVISQISPIDITLLFGVGMEIQLAPQTAMQIGINYSRGLFNFAYTSDLPDSNLIIKNDLYGIDIAIKF
ncbi:MAG: PorT family protein [Cyclobacteriaceae bacterium]|nr:PorT family protein [Cyclobacteriaceae bacterium]